MTMHSELTNHADRRRAAAAFHELQRGPELCPPCLPLPDRQHRLVKEASPHLPCSESDWGNVSSADAPARLT
jgi:hypothetical protein